MISHIEGLITEKTPTYVVIDCNGVGYSMNISLNTYSKITALQTCKLLTEQVYVRDDLPRFYGFIEGAERNLFRQLISVSGVGGTSAIMMLSSLSSAEIQDAIVSGNVTLLKSIKGIGEKTAQRIIVDLKGKLGKDILGTDFLNSSNNTLKEEALSALQMLGFAKNMADKAIDKALKIGGNTQTIEQVIKLALRNLS